MSLTIEQLKFAREIGATHIDTDENPGGDMFYRKDRHAYINGHWDDGRKYGEWGSEADFDIYVNKFARIDFTPLDDYYADKAVDIAATSVPDGYYHDDEGDKLKPLRCKPAPDMVNHPPHYQADGIECIDAIRASLGLDGFVAYCRGNSIKYSWRAGKKADAAQDLRKAAWYLNRAADELEKNE